MKIILSILLKLILIFTLIASIVGYFILFTNVGLQITYKTARYFTSGKLLIKNLNGNIVDGLDIDNILYSSEDFKIDITKFKSNLSFNIFKRKLIIESILIENIAILSENSAPSSTETTTQNSKENEISSYLWLLNIEIKNININGLFIRNSTSSPLSFVNIKIINTIIDNEKIASEKIITTYNKYTYDASSKLSLEKPFKIQMDLNAKNNFIDQQYNIMVIGNLEHIECEVDGKNISNIDLKLNFDIKDNFLKLATNWKNGNIMYGNKNLIFSEGHANISTEIKSENNSKCSNIICLINLVTKNLENDKHVYFNNLVSDIKFNDYHITSKNNLDINQNLFSTDGELYIKNDSIFMDVQAQYSVDIKEDYIYFKNFKSRDQGNNINVNGVLSKNSNLKYDIYIEELSKYSSILGGKISSSGEILGDLSLPKLKISAVIDKINSPNFKNEHSEINITLDTKNLTGSGNIHLQGIEYDELNIDTVDLNLQNLKDSQRITLALNTEKIKINSNIKHILDKEKHTFIIQQLKIVDPTDSIWNIKGSPKILLEDEHILTDRDLCLINQNDKICLGISYLNKKNFNIKANVRTYNNLINYYIHPLKISSPLSFNLHYTAKDNALIKADLNFMSKNIVILSKFGEQVSIKEASLSTKFKDNSIFLLAKITSDNNNETILKLNYDNTNLSSSVLKRAKISGSLNSTYNDHRFMDSLINSIDDIKGNFQTQIDISGTLQSPLFNGFSKFDNGSIFVSPLFLKIFDINYHLKINNNNFTIIGGMNSGKGNIKIDGNGKIENLDISKINFQVDAKNFRIYDTNNIILDINSALYISKDDYLQLKGNIDIINGSITIESFPDVESLSSDIVVDTDPTEKNTTPLFYDIDVNISDKIKLSAYKITGNLDGKLRLVNNNIYSDAVLGNINIKNGNFIFFNNLLKINKGEILYAGTSIDNPDIDLKASTKILSMSNTIEEEIPKIVGVQATGRIYSPEIQLFAVPAAFSDEDILSYLAFGKSTRQISGNARTSITSAVILLQGSDNDLGIIDRLQRATGFDLDISTEYSSIPETQEDLKDKTAVSEKTNYFIGKQITPKLKVSIGYSKSANKDAEQIFRATYNLTRRWQLALERKSELDTALRILYNIEFWE